MANQVTVKSGDTLSAIASKYNIKTSDISGYKSGNPNLIYPGEVLNLSNVGSSINASDIKPTTNVNLPTQTSQASTGSSSMFSDSNSISKTVDKYRKQLESTINEQKAQVDTKLEALRKTEADTLGKVQELTTPFRADLEAAQREKLYINQNFEENQKLINELDTLLTQGNDLIKQQQGVTGLASVRNPRIQQTMSDVNARAGVIEAVINARNGQIAVAENIIDRSVNAIAADRQDQLSYYETVLNLNRQDITSLDAESKKLAETKVSLIANDLSRAQETADYVKKMLVDPATASLMGEAGVSLNDSVESINAKLKTAQDNRDIIAQSNEITSKGGVAVVDPSSVPQDQLASFIDAKGVAHYYKMPAGINTSTTNQEKVTNYSNQMTEAIDAIKTQTADMGVSFEDGKTYITINQAKPLIEQWISLGYTEADWWKRFESYVYGGKPE